MTDTTVKTPKAATPATPAKKAERKKPVRQAPVQKDFPNKLAWLKAMTEFEEKQTAEANVAKVARLDKRIAGKKATIETLQAELKELESARAELVPDDTDEDGLTEDDHLALEGKD